MNKTNDIKKHEKLKDNKNIKPNKKMLIISKNKEPEKKLRGKLFKNTFCFHMALLDLKKI